MAIIVSKTDTRCLWHPDIEELLSAIPYIPCRAGTLCKEAGRSFLREIINSIVVNLQIDNGYFNIKRHMALSCLCWACIQLNKVRIQLVSSFSNL